MNISPAVAAINNKKHASEWRRCRGGEMLEALLSPHKSTEDSADDDGSPEVATGRGKVVAAAAAGMRIPFRLLCHCR